QVVVPNPDILGREKILKVHMKKVPLAPDVDAKIIARGSPGFSGADLANLVNEAALLAARAGHRVVTMSDFENAKDKVLMGAERRSMVMTEEEKRLTAYHEAGHAIVGIYVPKHDPIHKVTIIPRGRALGLTMSLPERDQLSQSQVQLESKLAMAFGGRTAEELIFGKENITTGAGGDIQQATYMARRMVTEFGFSDKLGRLRYADNEEEVFLGHSVARQKNVSDATAALIDEEVRRLIDEAEHRAHDILTEHLDELHRLAEALLEYETLTGDEVKKAMRGEAITREDDGGSTPTEGSGRKASVPDAGKGRKPKGSPGGFGPEPQPES
ncbi:MAG: cell division protein FtsH, partial [Alphaproteobacteria bacterium]